MENEIKKTSIKKSTKAFVIILGGAFACLLGMLLGFGLIDMSGVVEDTRFLYIIWGLVWLVSIIITVAIKVVSIMEDDDD